MTEIRDIRDTREELRKYIPEVLIDMIIMYFVDPFDYQRRGLSYLLDSCYKMPKCIKCELCHLNLPGVLKFVYSDLDPLRHHTSIIPSKCMSFYKNDGVKSTPLAYSGYQLVLDKFKANYIWELIPGYTLPIWKPMSYEELFPHGGGPASP